MLALVAAVLVALFVWWAGSALEPLPYQDPEALRSDHVTLLAAT